MLFVVKHFVKDTCSCETQKPARTIPQTGVWIRGNIIRLQFRNAAVAMQIKITAICGLIAIFYTLIAVYGMPIHKS
jgi:hypothetical protein